MAAFEGFGITTTEILPAGLATSLYTAPIDKILINIEVRDGAYLTGTRNTNETDINSFLSGEE